ncbi:MAG TPA: hypothetical protein VF473_07300 [Cyclobacteriaceae bacterium]
MKKLILITSCVALFAATSYAQDTTRTRRQTQTQQEPQQRRESDQSQRRESNQMRNDDMKGWTKVQASDVPEAVRQTLSSSQYTGWESGTIYRDKDGDKYRLTTSGSTPKTYYFDKNGKVTTKPNHGGSTNPH